MIGIVIPCYNRLENLKLCLMSLELQTYTDFEVVISDDGSTDGTRDFIESLIKQNFWKNKLRWIGCGPNTGVRTGRARNIGAANLSQKCTALVMLDTDVILGKDTMAAHATYMKENPRAIILGRTDWLPKMDLNKIKDILISEGAEELRCYVPDGTPVRVDGTFVGPELRESIIPGFWTGEEKEHPYKAQFALPLNSCYPLDVYWTSGGHNEKLSGYGFQDMIFGFNVENLGGKFISSSKAWALHVWHPKKDPEKRHFEAQKNLDYLIRNFSSNNVFEGEIDWSVWWHYHKERGGALIIDDDTLWAVNTAKTHKIEIPRSEEIWLNRLGHDTITSFRKEKTGHIKNMGIVSLTGVEQS